MLLLFSSIEICQQLPAHTSFSKMEFNRSVMNLSARFIDLSIRKSLKIFHLKIYFYSTWLRTYYSKYKAKYLFCC